jgi:LmbE family N-acetylglucosaminyl deacetylase
MSNTSILAVFAHPDDELTNGGTLARYAVDGVRVVLACATRGEAGEISEPHLASRETLVRLCPYALLRRRRRAHRSGE